MKALTTQAGELPLIPDWHYSVHDGNTLSDVSGVHRDRGAEDHDQQVSPAEPPIRILAFRALGPPNALTQQMVVVKSGAPVVKGANFFFAHYQVNVQR